MRTGLTLLICLILAGSLFAGNNPEPASEVSPYLQMIADDLGAVGDKVISLAEEVPADKYSWRPEEGVRSVSEVFVHIGGANHFILSFLGKDMPEGFSRDAEKNMTGKEDIVKFLKSSFEAAKKFVLAVDADKLDETVKLPFAEMSQQKVLLLLTTHCHEHLGQSIAYARTNGVTPPWSKKE